VKLGRLSVGTAKPVRSGIDDLLSSTEGGKHDYDWYVIQIWHDLELVDSIWGIKPRNHVFEKQTRKVAVNLCYISSFMFFEISPRSGINC